MKDDRDMLASGIMRASRAIDRRHPIRGKRQHRRPRLGTSGVRLVVPPHFAARLRGAAFFCTARARDAAAR